MTSFCSWPDVTQLHNFHVLRSLSHFDTLHVDSTGKFFKRHDTFREIKAKALNNFLPGFLRYSDQVKLVQKDSLRKEISQIIYSLN